MKGTERRMVKGRERGRERGRGSGEKEEGRGEAGRDFTL